MRPPTDLKGKLKLIDPARDMPSDPAIVLLDDELDFMSPIDMPLIWFEFVKNKVKVCTQPLPWESPPDIVEIKIQGIPNRESYICFENNGGE
jgi:hypothetical protein